VYGQISAVTPYVPFGAGNTSSGAPFGVLGYKMINDTKRSQLQNARRSRTSSGARTGWEQVWSDCRSAAS